jgi:hypothetical protein
MKDIDLSAAKCIHNWSAVGMHYTVGDDLLTISNVCGNCGALVHVRAVANNVIDIVKAAIEAGYIKTERPTMGTQQQSDVEPDADKKVIS